MGVSGLVSGSGRIFVLFSFTSLRRLPLKAQILPNRCRIFTICFTFCSRIPIQQALESGGRHATCVYLTEVMMGRAGTETLPVRLVHPNQPSPGKEIQ
jgi:hypothetical protein